MTDLNDFLKLVADGKKNTPSGRAKQIEQQVKTNVKSDLSSLFEQLASVKTPQERLAAGEPVSIKELPEIQVEVAKALEEGTVSVQGELNEVVLPTPVGKVPELAQVPDLDKYLKPKAETPKEEPLTNEFKQVNDKIKFLERWVSQIQNTGPGSGEVNFRYLDDVNRLTMSDSNDNWVLEYDIATKKVQFTENIGPIRTVKFNTAGYQTPLVAGQMGWNEVEDCLDIKQADDTTLQVGLEHYIQVHNDTGQTLPNGSVVQFAGVIDGTLNPRPLVAPFVADSSSMPIYMVGVLTNEISHDSYGRATVFGKVHEINTTGSDVGETWLQGDLLWAHPSMPGKMTKVRPTAPNTVISIAAVLHVSATDGWILVRPTIFPRLYFASFASDQEQTQTTINTPKVVTFNTNIITSGFTTINGGGSIKALNAGLYNFKFSLQLHSANASVSNVWIWIRHNGVDVPLSARKTSISGSGTVLVPSWNYQVSMLENDTFELMWASDSTNVHLFNPAPTDFCPSTPSATLAVSQVNL